MDINYQKLEDIADEAGIEYDNISTDYSGRGMYGKDCIGFYLESNSQLLSLGAALQTEGVLDDFVGRARLDSLGYGSIVYFPGITCEDGPKGEDDFEDGDE